MYGWYLPRACSSACGEAPHAHQHAHSAVTDDDETAPALFSFRDYSVDLDDGALRIEEEDLVPILCKARAIIGVVDPVLIKMALERVDVIRAVGDVANGPNTNGIYGLATAEGYAKILRREMHLHVPVSGEVDRHVAATASARLIAWEHVDRHLVHLHDVAVEREQITNLARNDIDVVQLGWRELAVDIVRRPKLWIGSLESEHFLLDVLELFSQTCVLERGGVGAAESLQY